METMNNKNNKNKRIEDEESLRVIPSMSAGITKDVATLSVAELDVNRQFLEAEKKLEQCLEEMKGLVKVMMNATKKQTNVSKDIKQGLPKMEEMLDSFQHDIKICLRARRRLMSAPSLLQTPADPLANRPPKRPATSPPSAQEGGSKDGEQVWTEVLRQKKKKTALSQKQQQPKQQKKQQKQQQAGQQQNQPEPQQQQEQRQRQQQQQKKKTRRSRAEAIALKPAQGKTYAEVLGLIRAGVKPEACGAEIKNIRRTRAGEVLIELKNTSAEGRSDLADALRGAVGVEGSVRELVPRMTLEILDLDCCTTQAEVEEALHVALPSGVGSSKVTVTKPNAMQQCRALVTLGEAPANELMKSARLRIGWVNCRVRRRTTVPWCFRCLGFGHESRACDGPNRGKWCYRCGSEEHRAADCRSKPRCFLCAAEEDPEKRRHVAGSGVCPVYRAALSLPKR